MFKVGLGNLVGLFNRDQAQNDQWRQVILPLNPVLYYPLGEPDSEASVVELIQGADGEHIDRHNQVRGPFRVYDTATEFDGVDQAIDCPLSTEGFLNFWHGTLTGSFTFWMKTDGSANSFIYDCKNSGSNDNGHSLELIDGSSFDFRLSSNGSTQNFDFNFNLDLDDDEWHFICVTTDGSNFYGYQDGKLRVEEAITLSTGSGDTAASLDICQNNNDSSRFGGALCHLAWFDYQLNSKEIYDLYQSAFFQS